MNCKHTRVMYTNTHFVLRVSRPSDAIIEVSEQTNCVSAVVVSQSLTQFEDRFHCPGLPFRFVLFFSLRLTLTLFHPFSSAFSSSYNLPALEPMHSKYSIICSGESAWDEPIFIYFHPLANKRTS